MGQDGEVGKSSDRLDGEEPDSPAASWDAERELRRDRRVELRLFWKEALIVLLLVALIVLRLTVVH